MDSPASSSAKQASTEQSSSSLNEASTTTSFDTSLWMGWMEPGKLQCQADEAEAEPHDNSLGKRFAPDDLSDEHGPPKLPRINSEI